MAYERLTIEDFKTVLTASQISHIEDGIVQNESDISANTSDISELNSALADIPLVQYGTIAITLSGEDYKDYSVTFSKTFSSTPVVITGLSNSATNVSYAYLAFTVISRSTTGFTVRVLNSYNGSPTPTLAWIAVGGA